MGAAAQNQSNTIARPAFLALSCVGAFLSVSAEAHASGPIDSPLAANDPADDSAAADPSLADDRRDIIVTGRQVNDPKQVAPLIDTPKSIVVLPSEIIQQTGSASLQDALRTVPGITFGAAEGGNPIGDRPFIRGFDSQGSIYVDGVRDLGSQTREVFAIDQVQIVRGSDSTLGGRGSAGGTINLISKLPQPGNFGSLDASFGNGNYKRVTSDVNLKLSDTAAFRIEGLYHDQNFVDRDAIYANRWGIAPSLTVGLGTSTRLTASYYYLESHELPDSGIPYLYVCSTRLCNAPAGDVFTTPALGNITTAGGQTGYVSRSSFYGLKDRDFRDTSTHQAMLRVEHDFGDITLRNTFRFNHDEQAYSFLLPDDSQGNVFGTAAANPTTGAAGARGDVLTGGYVWRRANTRFGFTESFINQTDVSGTFNTGSIKHSFAAGAEFSWERARRGAFVLSTGSTVNPRCNADTIARYYCTSLFNPDPDDPWVNYASDTSTDLAPITRGALNTQTSNKADTQAIYAFDSITLIPSLILNLGVRFDRFTSTLTPPWADGATPVSVSRTDNLFNWQAGLVFKPTPDTSLYASYATAATPPNSLLGEGREDNALPTNGDTDALNALKVQKTKSYEVGAKANLFHEKLALGLALFQTDIDNARVTVDANTVAFLGRTRIRGVELTASGTILPGWTVFGGYTLLDAKIIDAGLTALTAPAVGGQAAQTVYVPSVNNGRQVPQTARNSISLTTNYQATKRFSLGGGAYFMDRQYGGYADNRAATQDATGVVTVTPATTVLSRGVPAYWRFDAQARFAVNDNLAIGINAQNLTDKVYFSQAYASHYATIAPGRTVFGTVSLKF